MPNKLDEQFVAVFLEEASDVLGDWERHCLSLQKEVSSQTLDGLFRSAHNLKGSARSVGLDGYAKFIHLAEDVINLMRDRHDLANAVGISTLLGAQNVLVQWRQILLGNLGAEEPDFVDKYKHILIELKDRSAGEVKIAQAFGVFEDDHACSDQKPIFNTKKPLPKIEKSKVVAQTQETIRVPAQKIDILMQIIGELSTQQATINHCLKTNRMSERICTNAIQFATKLTRELQLQTMALRLVDMNRLLQRLERVAYDVAQEQGKPITIIVQGAEVELDKSVIDRMTDPLVHMVRNAVDHGVEPKGSRPSHKPAEATITLTASKSASGVQIELADDGRGIDPEKVLKKAVSLGLVKEGEQIPLKKIYEFLFAPGFSTAEKLTDISGRGVGLDVVRRMVDDLEGTLEIHSELGQGTKFTIVLPTNVSIIDSLVVLASGQHYVVPIQEVAEVIDLRSYHIESQTQRGKTIALREKAVTICPLQVFIPDSKPHSLLQTKPHQKESQQTLPSPAMIIDISGEKVGFEFEQVIGQQPILIRKLAGYIAGIPGFSGSTILATGEPAVILSPRVFARQYLSDKEVH